MVQVGELLREQIESQILPAWCTITLDRRYGGFRLGESEAVIRLTRRRRRAPGKQLVSQSRMLWNLSHAHRHGFRTRRHDLLARAEDGYRFLQRHLRDPIHGGYYWRVSRSGEPDDDIKALYGQAFVIFALVEFSRASRDRVPLEDALTLWRVVMERLHDPTDGGWTEHALADWSPPDASRPVPVARARHKSANAHLHWMEALIELGAETGDPGVVNSLEEVVDLLATHFYPADPGAAQSIVTREWQPLSGAHEMPISLGHNVEYAWLLLRAEQVLGRQLSVDRLASYLDHALETGFDDASGGLDTHPGRPGSGATHHDRIWWVQAELLACLTEAIAQTTPRHERYEEALRRQLEFVFGRQADPRDGLWWETVDEAGRITTPLKHHEWKAGYHELRALTLLSTRLRTSAQW